MQGFGTLEKRQSIGGVSCWIRHHNNAWARVPRVQVPRLPPHVLFVCPCSAGGHLADLSPILLHETEFSLRWFMLVAISGRPHRDDLLISSMWVKLVQILEQRFWTSVAEIGNHYRSWPLAWARICLIHCFSWVNPELGRSLFCLVPSWELHWQDLHLNRSEWDSSEINGLNTLFNKSLSHHKSMTLSKAMLFRSLGL